MTQPSYVCATSDKLLMFKTIGQAMEDAAATWGDREAPVMCRHNTRGMTKRYWAKLMLLPLVSCIWV